MSTELLTTGCGVTFLPGDPPRTGNLVLYGPAVPDVPGTATEIEVVLPTARGSAVRRRRVPARLVPMAEAIGVVRGLEGLPGATEWQLAFQAGLSLVARGRLFPGVTGSGWDTWRVGPLDPSDRRFLGDLAACFPPAAHAMALHGVSPLRLHSPQALVRAAWDALADTLVRTAAAHRAGSAAFAVAEAVDVRHLSDWLGEAGAGLASAEGVDLALRIELVDEAEAALSGWLEGEPGDEAAPPVACAVLQLGSRADPSLIVDAADLFSSPAAVLAMFGESAEADLLHALRRGARAWPALGSLLRERVPAGLELGEDLLADLLEEGTSRLAEAGIQVLWPSSFLRDGIEYRASLSRVGVVERAGFSLDALVEFRWQATLNGDALSEEEIDLLAEAKRGLVRLRGRFVAVDAAAVDSFRKLRTRRLSLAEAIGAVLGGSVDLDGRSVEVVADRALTAFADRLHSAAADETPELGRPPGLAEWVELRPYQARGVSWLHAMAACGLGGCLADDMGLGKTLQVISLHLHRCARTGTDPGPTLVVCPTSLVANWEREVRRFAPGVPVRRYHGSARSLGDLAADEIVITSYGIARREAAPLASTGFSLVVADEAQHVKNPETAAAKALRTIGAGATGAAQSAAAPGRVRLALTGPPVEIRLSDLWSILDWTNPGLLGPLDRFLRTVATPIERNHDQVVTQRLSRSIRPFLLRRRKSDPGVAPDLPPRVVTAVPVPLTQEQATLYEAEVREAMDAIAGERPGIARQALVLKLLTALKQICNHPAQYLHQAGPLPGRSGKLAALEELLDVIVAEDQSALVFSQFVECLSLVEARLSQLAIPSLFLHGGVAARRRMEMVDAFQAGQVPVMLLSLKAGGVGLNLTRATHVVHYDRWWNPAVEDQATDRTHRIGQQSSVQVHLLMAEGTLEDRIAAVIERKRGLAEIVVGSGEGWIGRLSNEELADLVRLGGG